MDLARRSSDENSAWVAAAVADAPLDWSGPEKRAPAPPSARRALAFGILGMVFFGFVFGPLALMFARRVLLEQVERPSFKEASVARSAMALGKAGLALHLMVALTALPWVLFMCPFLMDS